MADPFRSTIRRCELCDAEVDPAALGPLAGFSACASCRAGELDRALARRGLTCTSNEHHNEGSGSTTGFVEVRHPTVLELAVKLDADTPRGWLRRLLEAGDPEVGDRAFDDRVKVAPADGSFTEPALAPIRRFMPNLGGLDISPIILILVIMFIQRVIAYYIYPNVV